LRRCFDPLAVVGVDEIEKFSRSAFRDTEDSNRIFRPRADAGFEIPVPSHHARSRQAQFQARVAGAQPRGGFSLSIQSRLPVARGRLRDHPLPAQFKLRHDLTREDGQRVFLACAQLARHVIEHAQRAERITFFRYQLDACIKTPLGRCTNQRVTGETLIQPQIGNDQQIVLQQRMRANRGIERHLAHPQADLGFEPLAVLGDEVDDRDRCLADLGEQARNVVERRLGRCIENTITVQRGDPAGFVIWFRRDLLP